MKIWRVVREGDNEDKAIKKFNIDSPQIHTHTHTHFVYLHPNTQTHLDLYINIFMYERFEIFQKKTE